MDNFTLLGTYTIPGFSLGTWYTLALRANGNQLSVEVNGVTRITATDSAFTNGQAGVWSYQPASAGSHRYDNFSVTTLGGGSHTKVKGLARPLRQSGGSAPCPSGVLDIATNERTVQLLYRNEGSGAITRRLHSVTVQWPSDATRRLNSIALGNSANVVWQTAGGVPPPQFTVGPAQWTGSDRSVAVNFARPLQFTFSTAVHGVGIYIISATWDDGAGGNLCTSLPVAVRHVAGIDHPPAGHTWRSYYFADGQRLGMREQVGGTSTLYWLPPDHLGSTALTVSGAGAVTARQYFRPWGEVRFSSGVTPTRLNYTGQRADATGLLHYNARYYYAPLGRFISPDPLVPEPGNPQALNRYAYVYNNPLRYTDPSGHCPICFIIGAGVALLVWLAYPEPVYAPEPGWTPPPDADPNYGDRAYFDAAPGTGDLSDAYAAVTGRTLFTGEEVQGGARLVAVGATVLPLFTSAGFRQGRRFIEGIDNVVPGSSAAVRRITGPLTDPLKDALRKEARDIFFHANPGLSRGLQVHHRVPLEWAHLFPDADPNRLGNLIGLDPEIHNKVTAMWKAFRTQHPHATTQDVLAFLAQVDQQYASYYNRVLPSTP